MFMPKTQASHPVTAAIWMQSLWLLLTLFGLVWSLPLAADEDAADPVERVAAGIAPVRYLVSRIVGPAAEVALLVPTGASAETYDPKPSELKRLAEAELLFLLNTPVERLWVPRLTRLSPQMQKVHLQAPVTRLDWSGSPLAADAPASAEDFHSWTSPHAMATWIDPVVLALTERYPQRGPAYRANAVHLRSELERLDHDIREQLLRFQGRAFLSQHPAWGYFASHYGLRQLSIEPGGREPGPRQLRQVLDAARAAGVGRVIVPAKPPDPATTRLAAELAAEITVVNELAEDYPASLRQLADLLVEAFQ